MPGEIWEWCDNPQIKGKVVIFGPDFIMSVVKDPLLLNRPGFLRKDTHNPFISISKKGFLWIRDIFIEMIENILRLVRIVTESFIEIAVAEK